jgi:proteasome component ECM29
LETGEENLLDTETREAASKYLESVLAGPEAEGMKGYLSMLVRPLSEKTASSDEVVQGTCAGVLLEMVGMGGAALREAVVAMGQGDSGPIGWLIPFLSSNKMPLRTASAHLIGLIGSSVLPAADLVALLQSFKTTLDAPKDDKSITLETRHGAMLAVGYVISRVAYRNPDSYETLIGADLVHSCVASVVKELEGGAGAANASTLLMVSGSVAAIGELGRYVALPVGMGVVSASGPAAMDVVGAKPDDSEAKAETSPIPTNPRHALVEILSEIVKKGRDAKLQEAVITILSHLCLGDPSLSSTVLELYFSLATLFSKQIETHFTVGESIACVVGGWGSSSVKRYLDLADVAFPPPSKPELGARNPAEMDKVFEKLEEMLVKGGTAARKAVCVWLLSLVKFCSVIEAFGKKLPQVNAAFRSLLTDRDEFTQEVASKGIGLVYEMGDKDIKSELIKTLMGSLVDTKKQIAGDRGTLTGDTQLFDQSLGAAPGDSGGSISTYQSILSLAADMNQPELVYKFLNVGGFGAGR